MIEARNPFNIRKVENIGSDDTFLNLFQPTTLEGLDADKIWDRLHIFRSSQGGGKSSLLKLFTPGPLWRLWKEHSHGKPNKDWSDLFESLRFLGVFDDDGPNTLGVVTPCTRSYDALEHLPTSAENQVRLLNALFDARAISEAVKSVLAMRGLRYPEHAHRVSFAPELQDEYAGQIPFEKSSSEIIEWAKRTEQAVWRAVDDGDELPASVGHAEIYSFKALRPESLLIDGHAVNKRCLLMYDDVHHLGPDQRKYLLSVATESRPRAGIWAAERLQVLDAYQLISLGASTEREETQRNLANQWKTAAQRKPKVFQIIASKRMAESSAGVGADFEGAVSAQIEQADWIDRLNNAFSTLSGEVGNSIKGSELFKELEVSKEAGPEKLYDAVIRLKEAQIIIARNKDKAQPSLDMSEAIDLPSAEETRHVRGSAEYQLCQRFQIPYYYGLEKIAQLSSANVDQFLRIGAALFEELLSMRAKNRRPPVPARRQELVIQRAADELWDEIPARMPQGKTIQRFLSALGAYGREISRAPKASYKALTGFAITFDDHQSLIRSGVSNEDDEGLVANVLALCVAHNLLTMEPEAKQGEKGRIITKFYLNRLLCVREGLPLSYGGFHEKSIATLATWARSGNPISETNPSLDLFAKPGGAE